MLGRQLDPMFMWECTMSAVSLLPKWEQFHSNEAHLCLLPPPWGCSRLCDAHTWNGGTTDEDSWLL